MRRSVRLRSADRRTHSDFDFPQINAFYLQKEEELKKRLTTLLAKRQAAVSRLQDDESNNDGVEWRAVEEGFRLLEKDLGKLQVRPLPLPR